MQRAANLAILLLLAAAGNAAQTPAMSGFTEKRAAAQRTIEATFTALPSPERAREFHRYFTAEPHPAASERNNELARYIADTWKKQGLEDVTIHRYDVLNSFPRSVRLEMVSPVKYVAGLREDAYDVDPDTKNPRVASGYLSMSRSGDVTVPVVYANSGNPEDYEVLRKHGIDVRGKAVLVRYSNPYSYRGFKALTAERAGAAAILIYSDPAEDGFKKGAVFPDGPWGPESHIQRGAITYDFLVPGDPLTPGWPSVEGAKRVSMDEARSMPKIMGLAMSWRDAKPLLEHMGGPEAPASWQGGLPIKYRLGGEAIVHVKTDMNNSVMPNYVVEARIRGSEFPDDVIVLGNHRDGWEFGGVDPSSGTASMMEMTRALGQMLKDGVRPRRTLVFCSWDGEEVGLTGSTEWGEQFAESLKENLVAYLNVDSSVSGPTFEASAVASLAPLLVDVSRTLKDPSGVSLYEAWRASVTKKRQEARDARPVTDDDLVDTRIGSGSDHTVFLNHLGRPTVGLSFVGPYGVYHSVYDDFFWMNRFGDPGYRYHTLMAQLWGVVALRLANADVLPFDFEVYARHLRRFVEEVQAKAKGPDTVDLKPLLARIDEFEAAAVDVKRIVNERLAQPAPDAAVNQRTSRLFMQVEGNWLDPEGIPGRPWFKHLLYAARYTYANLELPGLTEAVEAGNWSVARAQAQLLEKAVAANTAVLRRAGQPAPAREIAVTVDDLPWVSNVPVDADAVARGTRELLAGFTRHKIPAIGFVNEGKLHRGGAIDETQVRLLQQWVDAGFELGNHTFSHHDLHTTPLEAFKQDVERGEVVTTKLLGKRPRYFRHPFLHTGRTIETKRELESFLAARSYTIAPVTVGNHDYLFAAAYDRATPADRPAVLREYLDYTAAVVAFYEGQSAAIAGREIRQTLLLHANRLNADAIDALAKIFTSRGYAFITLDRALEDPVYRSEDTYAGPAGITWLHRWAMTAGKPRTIFAGEPAVPAWIERAAAPNR